jgi:glycosyltransferase involved in cell wall biosynthesis
MRWYFLGQALREHGVEVEIVSSSSFHKYIQPPLLTAEFEAQDIDGLLYHWIRTRPYAGRGVGQVLNQFDFVRKLFRYRKLLQDRRPDAVLASSPHPFVIYPARSVAKALRVPLIYETRDLWPEALIQLGKLPRWHPYILLNAHAEHFAVKHAATIFSVKQGEGQYFARKYGSAAPPFAYIPNGFLPGKAGSQSPDNLAELRARYRIVVGYVGAISRYYGLDELVELAARFRDRNDIGFVVFGGGDQAEEIQTHARNLGLHNFHMPGKILRTQVESAIAQFDICYAGLEDLEVHKYGISCNKIFEYMYGAKPVLASYRAGYDPVALSGGGITVPRGDAGALDSALQKLLASGERREEMGEQGRRYFDEHHDFKRIAVSLNEKLRQIRRGI